MSQSWHGQSEPKCLFSVILLLFCKRPLLCWSFPASSCSAKMGTIMCPSFQLPPLCVYPLNYWAKEMGPVMAAWPECCQAAVPSQPFPELLVISHAQSDSQRQMVFKLNGCGRNLGAGLIGHGHARGLPRLGHSFQRHSHWIAVSRVGAIQTCHFMLICNFYLIST